MSKLDDLQKLISSEATRRLIGGVRKIVRGPAAEPKPGDAPPAEEPADHKGVAAIADGARRLVDHARRLAEKAASQYVRFDRPARRLRLKGWLLALSAERALAGHPDISGASVRFGGDALAVTLERGALALRLRLVPIHARLEGDRFVFEGRFVERPTLAHEWRLVTYLVRLLDGLFGFTEKRLVDQGLEVEGDRVRYVRPLGRSPLLDALAPLRTALGDPLDLGLSLDGEWFDIALPPLPPEFQLDWIALGRWAASIAAARVRTGASP